jgi:hypothetical protein
MTVRAKVRRDGPGEWSWTLQDDHGDLVTGINGSWSAALREVSDELRLMAEVHEPPGVEIPILPDTSGLFGTLGDEIAVVDDVRPAWKRWLGL